MCVCCDQHVHLDGAISTHVLWDAARRNCPQLIPARVKTLRHFEEHVSLFSKSAHLKEMLNKMWDYFAYIVDDEQAIQEI